MPATARARGIGRRHLLRAAASGAAGLALASVTRGGTAAAGGAPTRGSGRVRLLAAISYTGGSYGGAAQQAVEGYIQRRFGAGHPGVTVSTMPGPDPDRSSPAYQGAVTAALAGSGPDVLTGTDYQFPAFADVGALAALDHRVRSAGIDLSLFSPGHIAALRRVPRGLSGLPAFDGPDIMLVNYSLANEMGVPQPSADWTYEDAARIWTQATHDLGGTHHYGVSMDVEEYVTELFGGRLMDSAGTRCLLDDPRVLAAADWLVPLVRRGIVDPALNPPVADLPVRQGKAAFGMSPGRNVQRVVRDMATLGVQWDWLPMPYFPPLPPGRRMTYTSGDWYGMNAHTANPPDLVWDLLLFLVMDPGYQQLLYRLTWVPPNRVDRWADWMAVVRALAPALRDKHLEYYRDAMGYGVPDVWFRYQPYVADSIIRLYLVAIAIGRIGAAAGLAAITRQVNALQEQGSAGGPA